MPSYQLHVSAGQDYKQLEPVRINRDKQDYQQVGTTKLAVRIQDFEGHGPSTCNYFEIEEHKKDQLSIQMQVTFDEDVSGDDLTWGNDFDRPIRDILPYGFSIGYNIMKWYIDPSIDGDPYSDAPYLYGKALSSMNRIVQSGEWIVPEKDEISGSGTDDGGDADAEIPHQDKARISYFLDQEHRKKFTFKKGQSYIFDFYTPYITLGKEFAIKLPGYNLNVEKYCGSQPLRYVLRAGDKVYLVVQFDLVRV